MDAPYYTGVRFKNAGKVYYFATDLADLKRNDPVVVETVRGIELGEVTMPVKPLEQLSFDTPLKPIIRQANDDDLMRYEENNARAKEAFEMCKDIIKKHGLDMHLVQCEYTLDSSKVIFMYVSDDRVDFRELLKELASVFRCRIELRQIGTRDKAKIIGGIGSCGLPLCCSSFLGEFDGVSINMAKNQMLAINIDKISGVCGRLMCCLKYEDDMYTCEKQRFPKIGAKVTWENAAYRVTGYNIINDTVKIEADGNVVTVNLSDLVEPKEKKQPRAKKNEGGHRRNGGKRAPEKK